MVSLLWFGSIIGDTIGGELTTGSGAIGAIVCPPARSRVFFPVSGGYSKFHSLALAAMSLQSTSAFFSFAILLSKMTICSPKQFLRSSSGIPADVRPLATIPRFRSRNRDHLATLARADISRAFSLVNFILSRFLIPSAPFVQFSYGTCPFSGVQNLVSWARHR